MTPLLQVEHLNRHFPRRGSAPLKAVDDVSFHIDEGEVFGLVGESGCGKSTTGRCILRLIEPTSGTVRFKGEDVTAFPSARLRRARREMQIVFQDPYSSLNPRMRVDAIVREPLEIHGIGTAADREARVDELFSLVGLDPEHRRRFPHEFSGGQRQRIGIARALALEPALVILDEAVSALDVSIQAQIVALLRELRSRLKLTYLFISHDLRLVADFCDRVAVMRRGQIVELASAADVFNRPKHPYTEALLASIPSLDPDVRLPPPPRMEDDALQPPLREVAPGHWARTVDANRAGVLSA
ncbi:MAG: ATP-binding cassette domain-containing protein [Vicinamibacterales bacterium]|nr:ATP-binding cassette domain-containing protein [Vicinamibacterales bacterium]